MADFSLTVYHLYPDLLNLYGDKGNISVLKKRCEWRKIACQVKTLCEADTPDFSDVDIVLLGGGSNREQLLVSQYASVVAKPLRDYVQADGVTLAVCAGYQLMGNFYEAEGKMIPCFGILDIDTVSGEGRLIGNVVIEAELGDKKVLLAGFENHGGRTNIKQNRPLGRVVSGFGNDGQSGCEGVLYKNTVATYLHGPILPKNPELADFLILRALQKKYPGKFSDGLAPLDDSAEQQAKQALIDLSTAHGV